MIKQIIVSKQGARLRLDKFLSQQLDGISRTKICALIEEKKVCVDGEIKKPSYCLKENQAITLNLNEDNKNKDTLRPYKFDVKIIYEDEDIIIVDKSGGLVVHPPQQGYYRTLVNALLYQKKELSTINLLRRGVVHRLDKETSGVMVLAKNNAAHLNLIDQFKTRKVKKEYWAVCWGIIAQNHLTVDLPLKRDSSNRLKMKVGFSSKSKPAYTELEVIKRLEEFTFVNLKPVTGRMHQIRVHLKFLGYPILGDKKYGLKDTYEELFLHAHSLSFYHPRQGGLLKFESPLPERFKVLFL